MSEWKKVKLGDICKRVTSGGTPKSNVSSYYGGDIPWLNTKEVDFCRLYTTETKITQEGYNNSSTKWIEKNSVIVAMYGNTAGKVALSKIPLTTNQACCNLTIDNSIADYEYVYYYLMGAYQQLANMANGAAQKNLNAQVIKSFEINLPIISTQHHIATILSHYDSLIENYQKQIKLLEESAQRLYKEWFIDLRFPGHENTKIVDGVPEGWVKKKIKDLVDLKSGYAFKSSAFVEKGKYKIVTIKNVKDGVFDGDNVSYLNSVPEKMPSHCILQTGDILLSLTGNVGRICMVVGDNYLLNQRVAKLESKFPAFTYCLFRHYDTFVAINNLANGAAQQNVSPIRIGEMDMLVANDKIMHHFEKAAENIRTNILNLFSQIRHLTEARDRLLPKLMSGEIEV